MTTHPQAGTASLLLPSFAHLMDPNPADLKSFGDLGRAFAALERSQYTIPQILRIGTHLDLQSWQDHYSALCKHLNQK